MLRDRFVARLNNTRIQYHLLAEATLTFAKAQEIAQAMELVEKDVQSIQADAQIPVHKAATPTAPNKHHSTQLAAQLPSGGQTSHHCYCCGGKHAASSCYFKIAQCTVVVKLVTCPGCADLRHSKQQIQSQMSQ